MIAPDRFTQLAIAVAQDRDALAALEHDIELHAKRLNDAQADLLKMRDGRDILAKDIEVSEFMLTTAGRTFELTMPEVLPVEAVAEAHYLDDPTTTQALPSVQTGNGELAITNPDGPANGETQILVRRGRKVPVKQDGGDDE